MQPCFWGYWEKEMRSHELTYAVSAQNALKQSAGAYACLSPSSTPEGVERSLQFSGQTGQASFQCQNSAQRDGEGAVED